MARKPLLFEDVEVNGVIIHAKPCCKCKEWKIVEEYNVDKRRASGYAVRCKSCEAETRRKYRESNPEKEINRNRRYYSENKEKFIEYQRIWRTTNREKSNSYKQIRIAKQKELPHTLEGSDVEKILDRFDGRCALTGEDGIHLDHFIAISTGKGGTTYENIIPLSARLNISKGDKNPFTWFEDNCDRFTLDRHKFDEIIFYLAGLIGMTYEEYRNYVYDCYDS